MMDTAFKQATLVRRSKLAKHLSISPSVVDALVAAGAIPAPVSAKYWVLEDVIEWLRYPRLLSPDEVRLSPFDKWKSGRDTR